MKRLSFVILITRSPVTASDLITVRWPVTESLNDRTFAMSVQAAGTGM